MNYYKGRVEEVKAIRYIRAGFNWGGILQFGLGEVPRGKIARSVIAQVSLAGICRRWLVKKEKIVALFFTFFFKKNKLKKRRDALLTCVLIIMLLHGGIIRFILFGNVARKNDTIF